MGDIRQVSASSTYGARGVAKVSLLGRTGLKNPYFRLWHAILRTIAVFLAPRTVFMSVKPVRWPKKLVVVLSYHVGRQRAHPLVPNLNLKKAVFYNWPPLEARGRPIRRLRRLPRLWACSRPPSRRPRPPRRWARPPGRAERGFAGFGALLRVGAGGAAGGAQWCDAGPGKRMRGRGTHLRRAHSPAR